MVHLRPVMRETTDINDNEFDHLSGKLKIT
jgi:hypothetical protein